MAIVLSVLPLVSGCILAELAEVGALEGGVEVGMATTAEITAARAVAEAGFDLRGIAGGSELAAEGVLAEGSLERTLAELAKRHGTRLALENGAVTFDGRSLVFREDGLITLRSLGGNDAIIGRLSDRGELFDLSQAALPDEPIGQLRGTPRGSTAKALATASDRGVVQSILTRGQYVDVLRLHDGWYEIRVGKGTAWVRISELAVVLARNPSHRIRASPWFAASDSLRDNSPAAAVLHEFDHPDDYTCDGYDKFTCYTIHVPTSVLDTYLNGQNRVQRSQRAVRVLWNGGQAAVVEIRERFTHMLTESVEWGCVRVLLERSGDTRRWTAIRRGPAWTCGERSPWG